MTDTAPTQPAARDRLNLIEQLSRDAVASDYAGDRDRRGGASRRQQFVVATTALALAGFVLALGVSERVLNAPVVDSQRRALIDRIAAADETRDELAGRLDEVRAEVEVARSRNLEITSEGRELAEQIAALELVTGYSAVRGPGVVVTLTDAPPDDSGSTGDLERVLDSDVQKAVNGLWTARAEAIAINGQRLTARSAIRSAAGAILVNYRPLSPPYVIEAIGSPNSLEKDFLASADAAELRGISQQFGIGFQTREADQVDLRASSAALPEQASVVETTDGGQS